jgi:hypothetical protein
MPDTYLNRERRFAGIAIVLIAIVLTRLIHNAWFVLCGRHCFASPVLTFAPTAPEAYRVAIPILSHLLIQFLHLHDGAIADCLIQFPCCIAALYLLYTLTVDDLRPSARRLTTFAMFFALIQFPLAFVLFRQRPETLPTALFIALALSCISRAGHRWTALLLIATLIQSFARADFPIILGIALILLSARNIRAHTTNLIRGIGVLLLAGSIQLLLQFVLFPHLPYSDTVFIYARNLNLDSFFVLFLALSPFLFALFLLRSSGINLRETDRLTLLASLLYLPIWFTVGLVAEVRIFVPFLLALCVLAARILTSSLAASLPETSITQP